MGTESQNSRLQIVNKSGIGADTLLFLGGRPIVDCTSCIVTVKPEGLVNVSLECYAMNVDVGETDEMAATERTAEAVSIDLRNAYIEMEIKTMWPHDATRPSFRIVLDPVLEEAEREQLELEESNRINQEVEARLQSIQSLRSDVMALGGLGEATVDNVTYSFPEIVEALRAYALAKP